MIDAYSVGVTLKLHDLISGELLKVSRAMYRIDELAGQLNKKFDSLGVQAGYFRSLVQSSRGLAKGLDKATQETYRLDRALESLRANGRLPTVGAGAERNLAAANAEAVALAANLRNIKAAGNIAAVGGGHGASSGGGSHRGGIHGGSVHVGTNGVGVGAVGMAAGEAGPIVGGALIAAGAGAMGAKALAEAAGSYEFQKARFRLFGLSNEQNEAAFAFVNSQRIPGASKADMMRYMVEAQGAFRESGKSGAEALQGAEIAAPLLAKIRFASLLSGHELSEKQEMDMLRYAEQRGGTTNPQRFGQLVEDALKTTITSGGQVNFSELRQFMRTSQLAGMSVSDDALLGWYEPLMGELKGGPLGTSMATASKRLMGITKATKTQLSSIQDAGIWDMSKVALNKQGGVDHFLGDGIPLKHADEWGQNQVKYYLDYVLPYYMKHGYNQTQISKHNADLFGNTGGAMMDKAGVQKDMIIEGLEARKMIPSLQKIIDETKNTWIGSENDFIAAWQDFKTEFGKSVLPAFTNWMHGASDLLRKIEGIQGGPDAPKFSLWKGGATGYAVEWAGKVLGLHSDMGPKISAYGGKDVTLSDLTGSGGVAPPAGAGAVHVEVHNKIDERGLTTVVKRGLGRDMARPPTGPRGVDPTAGLFPVSASLGY